MSKALEGMHYCEKHQGNHSHYAEHNCDLCTAIAERDRLRELLREAGTAMREVHEGRRHPQLALSIIASIDAALGGED